ncbi:MAG: hypothetical protein ABNH00_08805 [Dokdonia sp.]|jgi:hypothetical protein
MAKTDKKRSPIEYLIGLIIVGVVIWQLVGYILPDHKEKVTTTAFVDAMLTAHGGLENWRSIKKLSFSKVFQLYDSLGNTVIDRQEKHAYAFDNGTTRLIQYKQDDRLYNLVEQKDTLFQLVNGKIDTSLTTAAVRSKIDAAAFVIGLPFSLVTPEAHLEYKGLDTLYGQQVHVLQARFENSADVWQLYFSPDHYQWLGYWVHTSDHYSLVLNQEMTTINGFTLPRKRKSFRTTADRDTTYIRARYTYSNYAIDR